MPKTYTLVGPDGEPYRSDMPGEYAGWNGGNKKRIFGTLDCASGMRLITPENRVFFADLETAVRAGYRPCQKCHPIDEEEFRDLKRRLPRGTPPERTLEEFYRRNPL